MNLRIYKSASERRTALEEKLDITLPVIGRFSLSEEVASTRNCENMIGAIQIPVGVAGPLLIDGQTTKGEFYIPLATTEGALVASINRGVKAITQSGGAHTISTKIGITRAPVFSVKNLKAGKALRQWVEENFNKIKEISESTSSHLTLLEVKSYQSGRNVYLRFRFDTQDAMGMNMATIAATAAVSEIEKNTEAVCIAVSGNMCVDKKPNFLNFIEGRGVHAQAEAVIPKNIITEILKTSSENMLEVYQRKIMHGSLLSGTIGANAQAANILAAVFLATGQDAAHIVEASCAVTTVEVLENSDLYISVSLPDLPVGVIGGGTQLSTQKEGLSILNITEASNGQNTQKLAEIIAGAVLAGELSLIASLAENSLACAHTALGRGKKI